MNLRLSVIILASALGLPVLAAHAERIKDMASIQGVRINQLSGYGLVVGLDGSGDRSTSFTTQSMTSMLQQLGVNLPTDVKLDLKNVAAVMVTAALPPFAQPGQMLDVTVSSISNAKSLRGGTLLMTPLKGADNKIYAMAQGSLLVGGAGASSGGSKTQINHLLAGRINGGATVEREVPTTIGQGDMLSLELNSGDYSNASRIAAAINRRFGVDTASAKNSRVIKVRAPVDESARVSFLADMEEIDITVARNAARVIINARTGSVVMNQSVTIEPCALAHGSLSVVITSQPVISQPNAFGAGKTVVAKKTDIEIKQEPGQLVLLQAGVSLAEVVKALNAIGATPQDLLVILQAMKAAGSLHAELEII